MEVFGYLEVVHLKWEWNFSYPTASIGTGVFILHFTINMKQIWANLT